MGEPETVYDPTDIQIKNLLEYQANLNIKELATPEMVQMILQREFITLAELKTIKSNMNQMTVGNNALREEKEELRIELAKSQQREGITWIEIPVSILSGFSINMLTDNFSNGTGWFLLIVSLFILFILRLDALSGLFRKDSKNAIKEN